MIKKELLSQIMGEKVIDIFERPLKNYLDYSTEDEDDIILNFDTLGMLCKEYIHLNGWLVKIHYPLNRVDISVSVAQGSTTIFSEKEFIANTELEAVLLATQFIANEKGLL